MRSRKRQCAHVISFSFKENLSYIEDAYVLYSVSSEYVVSETLVFEPSLKRLSKK